MPGSVDVMTREPVVFVVDDDDAVRDSLAWLLQIGSYQVRTFASAAEFLDFYAPGQPGCVVADVRMPGMTGLELQKELADRSIDIPLILITGHSDVKMATRALDAGAMDFLEKPLDDRLLLELVQKAITAITTRH